MKILLDECVTHDLRPLLVGHDVYTVAFLQWSGIKNGELLQRAKAESFEALITTDAGIEDQHNAATLPLAIVILHPKSNRIVDVVKLVPNCLELLSMNLVTTFHHVR